MPTQTSPTPQKPASHRRLADRPGKCKRTGVRIAGQALSPRIEAYSADASSDQIAPRRPSALRNDSGSMHSCAKHAPGSMALVPIRSYVSITASAVSDVMAE